MLLYFFCINFCVGNMLRFGEGCEINYNKAVVWYSKAAEQNYTVALVNLGMRKNYKKIQIKTNSNYYR